MKGIGFTLWTFLILSSASLLCVSGATNSNGKVQQEAQARDSYVKAAEHSGSLKSTEKYYQYNPNNAYYYQLYPEAAKYYGYGNNKQQQIQPLETTFTDFYNNNNELLDQHEADSKTDPASLLTLAYNSVTSLSWITTGILAIILAPVLIPLVLSPIIFLAIVLYFIPVLKLDLNPPNNGEDRSTRSRNGNVKNALNHLVATGRFVQAMTSEEECIDRIVCEIGRMARGNPLEGWIKSRLEKFRNPIVKRISRSFQIAQNASNCKMLSCNPMRQFRKIVSSINGTQKPN